MFPHTNHIEAITLFTNYKMLEKVQQWLPQIDKQRNNHLLRAACLLAE